MCGEHTLGMSGTDTVHNTQELAHITLTSGHFRLGGNLNCILYVSRNLIETWRGKILFCNIKIDSSLDEHTTSKINNELECRQYRPLSIL